MIRVFDERKVLRVACWREKHVSYRLLTIQTQALGSIFLSSLSSKRLRRCIGSRTTKHNIDLEVVQPHTVDLSH